MPNVAKREEMCLQKQGNKNPQFREKASAARARCVLNRKGKAARAGREVEGKNEREKRDVFFKGREWKSTLPEGRAAS